MPSKNLCNKCYIPLQFSVTFRWSDRGKKKFTENFRNLLSSKVSGVFAKITNLCRSPFLEVLILKINATKLISIYRWEIQSTVQTIDSDQSVNVVFDLRFFFLILRVRSYRFFFIQLFWERLSEKVHATIPKGIVGGFEFTVRQRNLKELTRKAMDICLLVLKERNKSRFDS